MSNPPVSVVRAAASVRVVPSAPIVAVTQRGPPGPPGPASAALDHEHVQGAASAEWIVNHNLGIEPLVTVLSVGGVEIEANVVHVSSNQVRIYFASPQAGRARCV